MPNVKKFGLEITTEYAVWISPEGQVYWVPENHVAWACDHAACCGATEEEYRSIYKRFHEAWRQDCTAAREYIVQDLVRRGWVRVRRYRTWWSYSTNRTPEAEARLRTDLAQIGEQEIYGFREEDRMVKVNREGDMKGAPFEDFLAAPFELATIIIADAP